MKNKRNSLSSLILACALFANVSFASTLLNTSSTTIFTTTDSSISGSVTVENLTGDALGFDQADLSYYTGRDSLTDSDISSVDIDYYDVPLVSAETEKREVEYEISYDDADTYYTNVATGEVFLYLGFVEDLSYDEDTNTYTNSSGTIIDSSLIGVNYIDKYEDYLVVELTDIDMNISAITYDGNATALDLTGMVTSYTSVLNEDNNIIRTTIEATNGISDGAYVKDDSIFLSYADIYTGGIDITAAAVATGGDAIAVSGYIQHTTSIIDLEDTSEKTTWDNGNLVLDLTAVATATYDASTGNKIAGGTAIGIQYEDVVNDYAGYAANITVTSDTVVNSDGTSSQTITYYYYYDSDVAAATTGTVVINNIADDAIDDLEVSVAVTTTTNADGTTTTSITTTKGGNGEIETTTSSNNGVTTALYSDNGTANVNITAVSTAAGSSASTYTSDWMWLHDYVGAYGVIGDVYITSGSVSISAYAYDSEDKKEGDTLLNSSSGYGIAILGDAEFIGTKVTMNAYSDDGYATTVSGDLELSAGASLTANVYAVEAVGVESGSFTDSSLNATVVALGDGATAEGAADLYAKNSNITIAAYATGTGSTAIGVTTLEILGASTLNVTAVSTESTATGVGTLNLGYLSSGDLNVSIYAQGVGTATGVTTLVSNSYRGAVHSQSTSLSITAIATDLAGTATATGVATDIILSYDNDYIVNSFNTNINAQAISETTEAIAAAATATAVDGAIGTAADDLGTTVSAATDYTISLTGSYSATATATADTGTATATAIGIDGIVYADMAASVSTYAYASSNDDTANSATAIATSINGYVDGNVSGAISAYAEALNGNATATGINGIVDGDVSGSVVAVAIVSATDSITPLTATAIAIDGDVTGDISGTVSAYAEADIENGTATAIAIDGTVNATSEISGTISAVAIGSTATGISGAFSGTFSGDLSVSATSVEDNDDATAIGIASLADGATVSGSISVDASAEGEASSASATAIYVAANDSTIIFDDATITATASVADNEDPALQGVVTETAIDASGYALTTVGDATVSGNIEASSLTLGYEDLDGNYIGSTLTQVSGTLNADINISNAASNYSVGFDVDGDLPTINGTVIYSYVDNSDADSVNSALSTVLTATAAALVGDTSDALIGSVVIGNYAIVALGDISVEGANGLDYDLSNGIVTVTKTTYFQDKASNNNTNAIAIQLDALSTSAVADVAHVDGLGYTYNDVDYYTTEDEAEVAAEDAADAVDLATRTFKNNLDSMNLDTFLPHANSQIAQTNAETFSNLSIANVWRMRSLMSESSKTAREKAVEAIMANPEYDGEEVDPTAKPKRVAQFQSVNIIGSRDGGANAPSYDIISTGGTADLDFFFGKDLVVGVGLGSVYNKVDAGSTAGVAESTSFIINSYAMWSKDEFEVFASLGYAHTFNESKKSTTDGTAKSKWDSDSIYNLAGVAYSIDFENGLILRPMAMYSLVFQNYGETKNVSSSIYNANVDSASYFNFRTLVGAELVYSISEQCEIIARLFWSHEFLDNSYDLDYSNDYLSSYIGSLSYSGEEADRDMFIAGLGVAYRFENGISAYLDYNANASGDYLGHNLNAAIQMKF